MYQQPESKLLELWHKTARARLQYIHGTSADEPVTMLSILREWPRYKDRRGHVLVSFSYIHSCC